MKIARRPRLPPALNVVPPPAADHRNRIERGLERRSARLAMPAPHSPRTQAHSPWPIGRGVAGHCGSPAGCGKAVRARFDARDQLRRRQRFALTARISAAIPETMGAEKLVPRLYGASIIFE